MKNLLEMMALLKIFFETFWSEVRKKTFLSCVLHSFGKEELCTSQRQTIIKLIGKKDKDKRLIQNWRLISLALFLKLYQNILRTLFRHLLQIINPLMLMGDSLVKADV